MGHPLTSTNIYSKSMDEVHHLQTHRVEEEINPSSGVQDFNIRTDPLKRKVSSSAASNGSHMPALDSTTPVLPNGGISSESTVHANGKKLLDKNEGSFAELAEESHLKRKGRPLVQDIPFSRLQHDGGSPPSIYLSGEEEQTETACCPKRSKILDDKEVPHGQTENYPSKTEESEWCNNDALGEESTSGSTEDTETDSLGTDTEDDMAALSDNGALIELEPKYLERRFEAAQAEPGSMSSQEPDDTSYPSPNDPVSSSFGVSRWQLKGKRSLTKRPIDMFDRLSLVHKEGRSKMKQTAEYAGSTRGRDGCSSSIIDWEELAWSDLPVKRYCWEDLSSPVFVGYHPLKSMLFDVELKVQSSSSYKREHVPMISLMSKLNGNAIVGHPLPVEVLENNSTQQLPAPKTLDNDTSLPPVWRTARRTANVRVPRPRPSLASDGDEATHHYPYVKQEIHDRKSSFRKSHAGKKRFRREPQKKNNSSPSQKIRTLSSIGIQQKFSSDLKKQSSGSSIHNKALGVKPELLPTTAVVACIPVKLVFSRLNEELVVGRRPS